MVIIIIAALIVTAPFIIAAYLRLANRSAARAGEAWGLVEGHARVLLEDRRLDPEVGDMVEFVIEQIGSGKLTRAFLWGLVVRRKRNRMPDVDRLIGALNPDQEKQFLHFLASSLFYDSLRTPLAGGVLRWIIYWLAATAIDRTAPINRDQIEPVMSAAGRMCAT